MKCGRNIAITACGRIKGEPYGRTKGCLVPGRALLATSVLGEVGFVLLIVVAAAQELPLRHTVGSALLWPSIFLSLLQLSWFLSCSQGLLWVLCTQRVPLCCLCSPPPQESESQAVALAGPVSVGSPLAAGCIWGGRQAVMAA